VIDIVAVLVHAIGALARTGDHGGHEFDGNIWPPEPSLEGFRAVLTQGRLFRWSKLR
jgi:hypothetical protein